MRLELLSKVYLPLLILALFSGCKSDDDLVEMPDNQILCEETADLGLFELLVSSINFLPYPGGIGKVIFTDADGEEYEGDVSSYLLSNSSGFVQGTKPCPYDSTIQITYNWQSQTNTIIIDITELNISLRVSIRSLIDPTDYSQKLFADYCSFVLFHPADAFTIGGQTSIVINERTHPNPVSSYSELAETFSIHGSNYSNVYVDEANANETFELYLNSEQGVVGFKSTVDPALDLKIDRFE